MYLSSLRLFSESLAWAVIRFVCQPSQSSLLFVCLIGNTFCRAASISEPSPDSLNAAVLQHQTEYSGLEFEFRVELQTGKDGKFVTAPNGTAEIIEKPTSEVETSVSSRDSLRIKRSSASGDPRIWRDWRQEKFVGIGEKPILDRFVSYNGEQTRLYARLEPDEGLWSPGHILPYEDISTLEDNTFDLFLHLDAHGQPQLSMFNPMPSPFTWETVHVTEKFRRKAYRLKGSWDKSPYTIHVTVLAPPEAIVIESITREGPEENSPVFEEYRVEALGEFEGVLYPSRGQYTRQPSGVAGYRNYKFDVVEVQRIGEVTKSNWLPDFPPGTGVQDQINGKNFMVPHDEQVLNEARLRRLNAIQPTNSKRRGWFLAANIAIVVILAVAVFLRYRRQAA